MTYIAVIGHGVVGSGVVDVLDQNREGIAHRAKEEIAVKYILDLRDFNNLPYAKKFIKDFSVIENDPEVSIVVECIGGINPAFDYIRRSLLAGKSVVTSNKELVAEKGQELLQLAKERNLNFLFEASVGGGIPIIRPLSQCMAANEVLEIAGILNGTTNFILTKMIKDKMSFDDALKLAQELGYAERDPSSDVDGHDACRKICILASLAFERHVYPNQVHTEGIRNITLQDVAYANAWGGSIKLLGTVKKCADNRLDMCVAPMLVSYDNQLSRVDDVFNAILCRGNATGDVIFYGRGAGKLPTASAVVADVIDCVKHVNARKYLYWGTGDNWLVRDPDLQQTALYIRLSGRSAYELRAAVDMAYGKDLMINADGSENEAAFITPVMGMSDHNRILDSLREKGITVENALRVFGDQ